MPGNLLALTAAVVHHRVINTESDSIQHFRWYVGDTADKIIVYTQNGFICRLVSVLLFLCPQRLLRLITGTELVVAIVARSLTPADESEAPPARKSICGTDILFSVLSCSQRFCVLISRLQFLPGYPRQKRILG